MLARRYDTPTRPSLPGARIEPQRQQIRHILHVPRLQAKLNVGQLDDAYEREADRGQERLAPGLRTGVVDYERAGLPAAF